MSLLIRAVLVSSWLLSAASAPAATREETIAELIKVSGIAEMLDQARDATRQSAARALQDVFRKAIADGDPPTAEQQAQLNAAAARLIEAAVSSTSTGEAVAAWGRFYAADLTDEDLTRILAFYSSPLGQKDIAATKAGLPLWQQYLEARQSEALRIAGEQFTAEVRRILGPPLQPHTR